YSHFCPGGARAQQVTAGSGSSIGRKGMIYGAKVMAAAGIRLMEDRELREKAWEEFRRETEGASYHCPVPEELPIPNH
ncbi:MAG: hypothetical protein ACLU8D_04240, partial [Enterocloster sp.]